MSESTESGWSLVAAHDEAAALIAGVVTLDPDETYTRSELATHADVSLKTLHLADTLDGLVAIGLLERVGEAGGEATFALVDGDSLAAARAVEEAFVPGRT